MLIVDAHLDLSDNALRGRPVHLPANEQPPDADGIPTVGLPDLRRGNVNLICATIFCEKPENAHETALKHLDWYRRQSQAGTIQITQTWPADFSRQAPSSHAILLMEGADPIRNDDDAKMFFQAGIRIVGLTWKNGTRYAGGNAAPGPLTPAGKNLVKTLDALRIIHDVSHLADQAFWDLLDSTPGPVIASHSNCRAIVSDPRQLSDEMIRAVAARGGIIGINFFDRFLLPSEQYGKRRAALTDVVAHVHHISDLLGNADHVGLGTDMDGGLGRNEIPIEIETSADLPRVADALAAAGFPDRDIHRIMADNWLRFFAAHLPR
jgi:membrane dipeptidase